MNWISVKDDLPPVGDEVIVCIKGDRVLAATLEESAYFKNLFFRALDVESWGSCLREENEVTHWMSLPKPPKEQNGEVFRVNLISTPYIMPEIGKRWIVVNIGCIECGVSSNIVGIYTNKREAEYFATILKEKGAWRERGQNSYEVFLIEDGFWVKAEYLKIAQDGVPNN